MGGDVKYLLRRNLSRALRSGKLDEAEGILAQLKEVDPLSCETRRFELQYLLKRRQLEQAEKLASRLLELFPASARILQLAGEVAYARKDYGKAERRLEESYRLEPNWWTRLFLGKSLTQAGKFDEAEPHLLAIADDHPQSLLDLAWLYERKENYSLALRHVEAFLDKQPGHRFAESRRLRLRARLLSPADLAKDVQSLIDLGEEVPPELLPDYCEALFRTGQVTGAREFIQSLMSTFDASLATKVGWACYHHQAYDLATDLFIVGFGRNRKGAAFLSALETAAERCHRLEELISLYEAHAPEEKRLYGRRNRLRGKLQEEE